MWHRQGKVSLTKGSDVVTGVGTNWVENIRVGDAFQGPDGKLYQVINVASNEALAISPAYEGNTATNLNYWIVPIPGYSKTQADRLSLIISKLDGDIVTATEAADRAQTAAQQAQQWRNEAAVSAAAALQSEQSAALSADIAEQARDDAVAVVTGGTASIDPEAGKIPIAGAQAAIKQAWIENLQFELDALRVARNKLMYGDGPYPVLDFQFAGAKYLDPRIQFTRASTDWGFDAEGNYMEFGVNQPVFDHDPLTGQPLGLRVWPQRAYLTPHSASFLSWDMINSAKIEETSSKNRYGDNFFKFTSQQNTSPVIRLPLTFIQKQQEWSLVCKASDLHCVMLRVISGTDMRATFNLENLEFSTHNINRESVKVRRLDRESIELRVDYIPSAESGRLEIWAKRYLDTSVGLSDVMAGEHIYISSSSVCDSVGAPYVKTENSQVAVASTSVHLPVANLALSDFSIVSDFMEIQGASTSTFSYLWGMSNLINTLNYVGARFRRANLGLALSTSSGTLTEQGIQAKARFGVTISKNKAYQVLNGGTQRYSEFTQPLDFSAMTNLVIGGLTSADALKAQGYCKNITVFKYPLTIEQLQELTLP